MAASFCVCCGLRSGTVTCGLLTFIVAVVSMICSGIFENDTTIFLGQHFLMRSATYGGTLYLIVSIICVYGAAKENRYYLIPWLFMVATSIMSLILFAVYFLLFGCYYYVGVGICLLMAASLYIYAWVCVASYYADLRDRKYSEDIENTSRRSYLTPSAVTSPAAFAEPPPKYDNVVGADNPTFEEKPPKYEEVSEKNSPSSSSSSKC